MLKRTLCCLMLTLGFSCVSCAFAGESKALSNTAYLSAHAVKKVSIGRSFANCQSTKQSTTKLVRRYTGMKTCASANLSDVYYMVTSYFHETTTQLLPKKAMRLIERSKIKFSVAYREQMTSLALKARF